MTCLTTHSIEVNNISEAEVVNHSILLVSGRVCNRCTVETVRVEFSSTEDANVEEGRVAYSGEFRVLLDLKSFEVIGVSVPLQLTFSYCKTGTTVLNIYLKTQGSDYRVQPLYIVCRIDTHEKRDDNGDANVTSALQTIDLNVRLVQSVYADKIRAAGFGRRTFTLNGGCQLFYSQLTCAEAWQCDENTLWQWFAKELLNSEWGSDNRLKFIAFIGCTQYDGDAVLSSGDYSYINIRRHLRAHAALGGGGLALFGSAYFYAWPQHFDAIIKCFQSATTVNHAIEPDESNYRRTHGGVYASTLGAICHELGHIFDLGHTSDGIMGSAFDYINHMFTVDNPTEHLPTRVISKCVAAAKTKTEPTAHSRVTQLKLNTTNSFLDKYREQRRGNSFYFAHNSVVTLAFHRWLHQDNFAASSELELELGIHYDRNSCRLVSHTQPLKLIEIRRNADSVTEQFFEFQQNTTDSPVHSFQLPKALVSPQKQHIFVLTTNGHIKRLELDTDAEVPMPIAPQK